jgi:hypothetical protein
MNKKDIEKNRLDLSYRRYLQMLNVVMLVGGGSIVAYFAGLILNIDKALQYSLILGAIVVVTYILYNKVDDNLKEVSDKIKELA